MIPLLCCVASAALIELAPGDDVVTFTSALRRGDEVVFADGVYELRDTIVWDAKGTASAPIVIRAAEGAHPLLVRKGGEGTIARISNGAFIELRGLHLQGDRRAKRFADSSFGGLQIDNSRQILVENVEIDTLWGDAVRVSGDNSDLRLLGCHLHHIKRGVALRVGSSDASSWTADSQFSGNWIHDIGTARDEDGWGIYLAAGSRNIRVNDNVLYGIDGRAISTDSTEGGRRNQLEGNLIWDTREVGIRVEGAALVRNNLIFNIEQVGIRALAGARDALEDVVIAHNTVVDTGGYAVRLDGWQAAKGMVLVHNVMANPTGYGLRFADDALVEPFGPLIHGNVLSGLLLVDNLDQAEDPTVIDDWVQAGAGLSDFSAADDWDFYPAEASVLIDLPGQVDDWSPAVDINGSPRDALPDAGAYEYSGPDNPGWLVQEDFKGNEVLVSLPPASQAPRASGCGGSGSKQWLLLGLLGLGWRRRGPR